MKYPFWIISCLLLLSKTLFAQEEIQLYKNGPTESNGITQTESMDKYSFVNDISRPRMYAYLAKKEIATGTAVLICPGGSYRGVSTDKEGTDVAAWFNKIGISAFILYYRMPNGHYEIPLKDAQTALQIIKNGARKWNINKHKIGIAGFSAGGHLASTAATHLSNKNRPDFLILLYPVISMKDSITHKFSRTNLLGNNPSEELIKRYSNELHVTKKTPTTFIAVALDDKPVPAENSILFYKALQAQNVSAELNTFDKGGHGFGMRKTGSDVDNWPNLLKQWLLKNKLINQ